MNIISILINSELEVRNQSLNNNNNRKKKKRHERNIKKTTKKKEMKQIKLKLNFPRSLLKDLVSHKYIIINTV